MFQHRFQLTLGGLEFAIANIKRGDHLPGFHIARRQFHPQLGGFQGALIVMGIHGHTCGALDQTHIAGLAT